MAPFTSINTREVSRDILGASSRPISNGEAGPRVVKNKAKNLATQGSAPWDDDQRQQLVGYHARFETWDQVAKMLKRSNQAIRLEWKKMRDGKRDQGNQGHWQQKVKACEKKRGTSFPSKGSRARNTATTAPTVGRPAKDSSTTPYTVTSTSRIFAAETSSNATLSRSPGLGADMTGIDQTDTREDLLAETMRYQSLGSKIKGVEPHESEMLFREKEAWYTDEDGLLWYQHPWGFERESSLEGWGEYAFDRCEGLSRREIDADLRKMGIVLQVLSLYLKTQMYPEVRHGQRALGTRWSLFGQYDLA
ncbi:hypothetical protein KCU93_g6075, partial [Aureobasidium melanogenum]